MIGTSEDNNLNSIITIIVILCTVILVGAVGISMADKTVTVTKLTLSSRAASGTLTFTGNATDGALVNIGAYTFEFDTDGNVDAGHIQVSVTAAEDGSIDRTTAVTNLTTAIQNNASVSNLVSADSS